MKEKNFSMPEQAKKNRWGQLPMSAVNAGTPIKRYIKNCPWGLLREAFHCDKIPGDFVCHTPDCWLIGDGLKTGDLSQLSDDDLLEFIKCSTLAESESALKVLQKYFT